MWKLIKGKVPNLSPPIQSHISDHRGRLCNIGVVVTGHLDTFHNHNLENRAASLLNCLFIWVRNQSGSVHVASFKRTLHYHLCFIVCRTISRKTLGGKPLPIYSEIPVNMC